MIGRIIAAVVELDERIEKAQKEMKICLSIKDEFQAICPHRDDEGNDLMVMIGKTHNRTHYKCAACGKTESI